MIFVIWDLDFCVNHLQITEKCIIHRCNGVTRAPGSIYITLCLQTLYYTGGTERQRKGDKPKLEKPIHAYSKFIWKIDSKSTDLRPHSALYVLHCTKIKVERKSHQTRDQTTDILPWVSIKSLKNSRCPVVALWFLQDVILQTIHHSDFLDTN